MRQPSIISVILIALAIAAFPLSFSNGRIAAHSAHASSACHEVSNSAPSHHHHVGSITAAPDCAGHVDSGHSNANPAGPSHDVANGCCDIGACHAFAYVAPVADTAHPRRSPALILGRDRPVVFSLAARLERPPRHV